MVSDNFKLPDPADSDDSNDEYEDAQASCLTQQSRAVFPVLSQPSLRLTPS